MALKIKLFLTQLYISLTNTVRNTFNSLLMLLINQINRSLNAVKYLIKFNYHLICFKVLCFSLLTYSAIIVSID